MEKILLIDGSSLIFRAFYAIRNLTTKEGLPTGAVYGFINMYRAALAQIQPDYVMVAFDKSGSTFRTKEYADYKGTRDKTPDELSSQFGIVKDLMESFGVKHLALDEYEADDILGTISRQASEKGIQSYMLTGDRDYFQLVDDMAHVLYTVKGISNLEVFDIEKIKEKYDGLMPKDLIQVKALMGDASDNIPGVPGVGEKTAIKLVKEFKNLEGIYENLDKISGKALPQKLADNETQAYMSRRLGEIYTQVPLDFTIEDLRVKEENRNELYEKFKTLEFSGLMKEFAPQVDRAHDFSLSYIFADQADQAVKYIKKEKELVFDIVCEGDYLEEEIRFIGIKGGEDIILTLDLNHDLMTFQTILKDLFEDPEILKIGFDLKKSMVMLEKIATRIEGSYLDLQILSYLINPNGSYSIQDLGLNNLNREIKSLEDYLGKGKGRISLDQAEEGDIKEYMANNIIVIDQTNKELVDKVEEMGMKDLLDQVDLPLVRILADMELAGIETHKEEFEKLDVVISERIEYTQAEIFDHAGGEFNINSPKQLGEILFDKMGLPVIKKTKTGYSTNADVLAKLMDVHPIIKLIEDYRSMAKLKSTYIDGLIPVIKEDGRIHAKFNQTVAATGRLSSTEPNLQNIPIKTDEGRLIRSAFFAGKGKKFVAADYSQIELRVLAALTDDKNMLSAFEHGIDIHTKTASEVFNVDLDEVTPRQRSEAKAVNFGIVYGISDYGLSEDLNISRKKAKEYIDEYLDSYPNIHKYMSDIVKIAKKQGYVETMFKRRRYIPEISSSNFNLRSFGERMALNTPIQGTASDIIKIAMIKLVERLKAEGLESRLILQIHDELIVEALESELDQVEKIMKEEMENAVDIGVHLLVEVETGDTWYEV